MKALQLERYINSEPQEKRSMNHDYLRARKKTS